MRSILLGWELGGGLGHVGTLVTLADALASRGCVPTLALKDLNGAAPLLKGCRHRVIPAPRWHGPIPPGFQASRFTDVLGVAGYGDPEGLRVLVHAWRTLIEQTRAEAVVCDFAPTLHLAASGRVPSITIGIGFAVPPTGGDDFPVIHPGAVPTFDPVAILSNVRQALSDSDAFVTARLSAFLDGGPRFVHSLPELDPYRGLRRDEVVEPLHAPASGEELPSRDFFAYLAADFPGACDLLARLATSGFKGRAYLRRAPANMIAGLRAAGVEVFDAPPPLNHAVREAAVVIHHGGLATAEAAVTGGRPQVVFPIHLEQFLTARAIVDLGIGRMLGGRKSLVAVPDAVAELSRGVAPGLARDLAGDVQGRGYRGCFDRIVAACLG